MKTLFDTSVWVDHLRRRPYAALAEALEIDTVLMHPFVLGELILGGIPESIQRDLLALSFCPVLDPTLTHEFIRKHRLTGKGIGWVDASLLHSATAQGIRLHTLDKRLAKAASLLSSP